jgi:hypothetical protein
MPKPVEDLDRLREALERHADAIRNPQLSIVDQVIALLDDYRDGIARVRSAQAATLEGLGL